MSETLLIIAGVAVFFVTVIGVLIYFYAILMGLDSSGDTEAVAEANPRIAEGDG